MATTPTRKKPSANGTAPGRVIDLGAARAAREAARSEAQRKPVTLAWSDDISFELPVELPADFAMCAREGDLRGAVAALLGADKVEEFFALRPSMEDLNELVEAAAPVYGITPGESPASASS